MNIYTNILLVRVVLDSNPLNNILNSSLVDEKNIVEKRDPTKSNQPGSLTKILHINNRIKRNEHTTTTLMIIGLGRLIRWF